MRRSGPVRPMRWLLPALLILAWLGLGGVLGPLAGKLGEVVESGAASYLPRGAEATQVLDLVAGFGEPEALPAVVVYEGVDTLGAGERADMEADARRIAEELGPRLAAPPIGPQVSSDGRAGQIVVLFAGTDETKISPYVQRLRELVPDRNGLSVRVTGTAGVQADLQDALGAIDLMLLLITSAVILIILVLVYRSPILPLLVLAVAVTALGVTQGVIYLLAQAGVLSLGSEVQGILSVLVIGAATDYALLLIARFREELRVTPDRFGAMARALRASAAPILASSSTVALGLLCLLISDLGLNRQLGPAGALGIGCAVLAMLTFLPAVLVLLGRAAFWPRRPVVAAEPHSSTDPSRATTASAGAAMGASAGVWARVAAWVARRPRPVWVGTAVVLALMAVGVGRLDADGLTGTDMIISDSADSKVGQRMLSAHFPAGSGSPVVVVARAETMPEVLAAVRTVPHVDSVTTFPTASVAGQPSPAPMVVDGLARADVVLSVGPDSKAAVKAVRDLRAAVDAVPGAAAKVGGVTAVKVDFDDTAARDRIVIPVLLLVVLIVLLALLRSVVAAVLLLATVVLSFFAAIGVSAVVFEDLLGFPGVDSTFPLHAFVFLVALGVDYNIFLVSRAREESRGRGTRRGGQLALAVTGGVITSAGVVLAATFAALAVIPLVLMVELAFTVAFGVLLDTLVVRTLLVPALMFDTGRRFWWPSRLSAVCDPAGGDRHASSPGGRTADASPAESLAQPLSGPVRTAN